MRVVSRGARARPPPRFMRPLPSPLAQLSSRYNIVVYSEPRLRSVNHPSPVLPLPHVGGSTGNNRPYDPLISLTRQLESLALSHFLFPVPPLSILAFTLFSSSLPFPPPLRVVSPSFVFLFLLRFHPPPSSFFSFFFFTLLGDLQHQRQMRDRQTTPPSPLPLPFCVDRGTKCHVFCLLVAQGPRAAFDWDSRVNLNLF